MYEVENRNGRSFRRIKELLMNKFRIMVVRKINASFRAKSSYLN